jgi:AcrR family transcriptional regulator
MPSTASDDVEVQRRTPRDEGVENMLAATVALLAERRPEDITVRDVAEASGHHHRFVQAWFGGKVGLFRAAFDRMSATTATAITTQLGGDAAQTPQGVALARLLNWLIAADPDALSGDRPTPVIDRVTEVYVRDLDLDPEVARLLAARAVGATLSYLLFSDVLGIGPEDFPRIAQLDREMVALLAVARAGDQQG